MFAYRLYLLVSLMLVKTILMSETEHTQSDVYQYGQKRQVNEVRQYCGKSLSSSLQIICDSRYNPRFKKSNQEMEVDDYMLSNHLIPYKTVENAKKMLRFQRNPRGIYEECCLRPCSTDELRSYCGGSR
ncbi:insulin-like peptide 2 [Calliopsis andreniformis]|uniref:insulin-like peptide 2 n=1 Tax=Calliopsis andreniformis TaxID=337506 RepID=UPI003FCE3D6B